MFFAIGSYTLSPSPPMEPRGAGITIMGWDGPGSDFRIFHQNNRIHNPAYLTWDAANGRLYAVSSVGSGRGAVAEFQVGDGNRLEMRSRQIGPGRAACHLTYTAESQRLYAVSYLDGKLTSYKISSKGIEGADAEWSFSGQGIDTLRQESSHPHQVLKSPYGNILYICDLGCDTIWKIHPKDQMGSAVRALVGPAGYGPRHLAFDPFLPVVYILCELLPKLLVAEIQRETGMMYCLQEYDTISTASADAAGAAAVKLHPTGKTLAVSNRNASTISVFEINRDFNDLRSGDSVSLKLISQFDSGGKTPRDIEFSSDGCWLLIANQDSHEISIRQFDPISGKPNSGWIPSLSIGSPSCIVVMG
jgi:6-phosphogluconolactonase